MEFSHSSIFYEFQILVVSDHGKHAVSICTTCFLLGTWKVQNIHPIKIVYLVNLKTSDCLELAYLSVKMTTLIQKLEIVRNDAYHSVWELRILFKEIKSSGKLSLDVGKLHMS